jgi:hypothetical protein
LATAGSREPSGTVRFFDRAPGTIAAMVAADGRRKMGLSGSVEISSC